MIWFFQYALQDPACRQHVIVLLAGSFGVILTTLLFLPVRRRLDSADRDLYELSQPVETYHFAPYGEIRAWDGSVEIFRSGACVGRISDPVAHAGWTGGKTGRTLEIVYSGGGRDVFDCGPAGWNEIRRVASIIMKYTGVHACG